MKLAKTSPEKELAFSYDKIASNFSNYSAWHYRIKLLPVLCPSAKGHDRINDEKLREGNNIVHFVFCSISLEFQLVQNAFYTDPNDQSAWFYHKWLIGRGIVIILLVFGIISLCRKEAIIIKLCIDTIQTYLSHLQSANAGWLFILIKNITHILLHYISVGN